MPEFAWHAPGEPPRHADLRAAGWSLVGTEAALLPGAGAAVLLPERSLDCVAAWRLDEEVRRRALILDVADPARRAHILRGGAGEALAPGATLPEIAVRAARVLRAASALPPRRRVGALELDLMAREGFVSGQPLDLYPREFALAWRLAEARGAPVGIDALLRDVWQLRFRPETNTLSVHVSRLRAKLRAAGLGPIVAGAQGGGYRFMLADGGAELDGHVRIGESAALLDEEWDDG